VIGLLELFGNFAFGGAGGSLLLSQFGINTDGEMSSDQSKCGLPKNNWL